MSESADTPPMKAPPATFEFLTQTLFTQALMAFGKIPNPITKESLKNLDTARHFILHDDLTAVNWLPALRPTSRNGYEPSPPQLADPRGWWWCWWATLQPAALTSKARPLLQGVSVLMPRLSTSRNPQAPLS
ncbi:MAG: DUF1844 domain-containing protein [Planctomycetia bacterium]|nr:DUF1844 domain-containing protein [Planctomycetia bacterium]